MARTTSLVVKAGALVFVVGLREQAAINLQLLGGVWILQTFPAVAIGLCSTWFHREGLLAGWAGGMVLGTVLVADGGFSSVVVVPLGIGDAVVGEVRVYAAVVALAANLVVAAALTPLLDRRGWPRGMDATTATTT